MNEKQETYRDQATSIMGKITEALGVLDVLLGAEDKTAVIGPPTVEAPGSLDELYNALDKIDHKLTLLNSRLGRVADYI